MSPSRSRTRPGSRAPRPRIVRLSLAAALIVALGGCAKMDAALGKQWVQVTFKSSTTLPTIEKVRTACSHVPNVHPEPLPKSHSVINLMSGVRYDTTHASDANVAQLQLCLQKFSSVLGFTPQESGDEGG